MWVAVVALVVLGQGPPAVTGATIAGVVVDNVSAGPIADAVVMLVPQRPPGTRLAPNSKSFSSFSSLQTLTTRTGADGRFEFTAVPPGRYDLAARGTRHALRTGGPKAPPVDVAGTERIDGLELSLPPAGAIIGRVVGPDGQPMPNIQVGAIRKVAGGLVTPESGRPVPVGGMAVTDDHGRFELEALHALDYYLRVRGGLGPVVPTAADGVTATTSTTYFPGTTNPEAAVAVTVVAGVTTTVGDLRLVEALAFDVSGTVVDDAGRPVPDVQLRMVPPGSRLPALPVGGVSARSDARGAFTVRMLPGQYLLVAVPPKVVPTTAETATRQGEYFGVRVGGARPDRTQPSVWVESQDGVTREYRDEHATLMPVTVATDPVLGLVVVAKKP